jgi:hypothetical protein
MIRQSSGPFVPAFLVLALAGAGCDVSVGDHGLSMNIASGKATDEWKRTYTIAAGGRLEIVNTNGIIQASPAGGGQVEVRAERIAKASTDEGAQELLKQLELREDVSPDRVRIETRGPATRIRRSGHEVRYYVRVPDGLAVQFETTNGAVRLENLKGQIVASTTNGGVRGSGLSGSVKASSTNGGVTIEMSSVTGDVDLGTTNGGIRLELPADVKAALDARCVNGGISVSDDLPFQGERTRRRVSGTLNGGGPRISVETVNGGVRISARTASAETH